MFQDLNTSLVFNSPQNILHIVFGIEFAYNWLKDYLLNVN